jgi:hypothetical protein
MMLVTRHKGKEWVMKGSCTAGNVRKFGLMQASMMED